ncbi:hypothetical protein GFM14_37490, partial [Rhizobium leguminosarum bv. viciae]|nr:hypothetical protein [Rhizobium leguminosarum bv. viciae]
GCSHRATWRIQNRRGSSRRWMKVQWQVKDVQAGAKARGLLLARIEDRDFIVSDGRRFALSECQVEFC